MTENFETLLIRFEQRVTDAGAPLVSRLAPGIASDVVRARLGEHGMEPGDDVLTWFGWHNGLRNPRDVDAGWNWRFYSLDEAVAVWHRQEKGPEVWQWNATWLPISDQLTPEFLAVECTPPAKEASRVRIADPWTGLFDESDRVSIEGLPTLVSWWIDAIDSGRMRYDAASVPWSPEWPTTYPLDRIKTGLV